VRALTVRPGAADSALLDDVAEPSVGAHDVVLETLLVGICGTDAEIVSGRYGRPPPGADRLVVGHEALARVTSPPEGTGFAPGDLVVPMVRWPDPVPCDACAVGEWDMCRNGRYTEHGIKGRDGFARERFAVPAERLVAVPSELGVHAVLVEPASIVAKAWEQVERIVARSDWWPRRALVTGAGPVGLLATLMARQRGYETHVLDRVRDGPKPDLVDALGATYHSGTVDEVGLSPDVEIECTGVGSLVLDAIEHLAPTGVVCLAGISSGARSIELDAGALNRQLVLENAVVVGTVNANRRHYDAAVGSLVAADPDWLGALVSRRVPVASWQDALAKRPTDVKVALELADT